MSATERLDQWAALAEQATSGPWRVWMSLNGRERDAAVETAWSHDPDGGDTELITDFCTGPDAAFIAASREAVPALIAALRAVLAHAEHHIAIADGHDHRRPCEAKARRAFARVLIAEINAALGVTS